MKTSKKERKQIPSSFLLKAGFHPNGIKPLGNQLIDTLSQDYINTRFIGLGAFLSSLDDSLIFRIFSDLDGVSLGKCAMVSRAFYCWSYHNEFWKPLVISDYPDFEWVGRTWRETYHYNYSKMHHSKVKGFIEYSPLYIPYFYSDVLFQSWFCSSIGILDEWLKCDNIDRVSDLSVADFKRLYEEPNKPVVITDIVKSWPAFKKWTEQSLCNRFGDLKFRAEAMDTKLSNYFKYANATKEETPMYLFDKFFAQNCPEMLNEYNVPEYFSDDLFSLLGPDRPDFRWLIIGPAKSGSSFHKDPNATSAWNATITGSKKWILFPPETLPPGVFPSEDGSEVTTPTSIIEWFLHFYRQARKLNPVECITKPGDLIFVPSGWWHTVINLETTIAVTQNYVSHCNYEKVLHFLWNKKRQISGICNGHDTLGDRMNEAYKREYPEKKRKSDENKENVDKKNKMWSISREDGMEKVEFRFDLF